MHQKNVYRSTNLQYVVAILLCALVGVMIPIQPLLSLALAVGLVLFVSVLVSGVTLRQLSLGFILVVLFGYLSVGRGFAYVGLGPIFVGEISLGVAFLVAATSKNQRRAIVPVVAAIVFVIFGLMRTLPFLGEFGLLAIRDAALYYYILFGVLLYFSLTESEVRSGLRIIGEAIPFYMAWSFIQLGNDITGMLPAIQWPGAPVGFWVTKPGDRAVVLAAIAAYVLLGLPKLLGVRRQLPSMVFWSSWIGFAAVAAIGARGGLLALAIALGVVIAYRRSKEMLRMFLIGVAVLIVIVAWNPSIQVGSYRELSVEQFTANITSIFQPSTENSGSVNQNRDWRLEFWTSIVNDTTQGEHRLFGMGYGVNLATLSGFQINSEHDLRSPHNIFVTVLGRMGMVGLAAWVWLLASFCFVLHRASSRLRKAGDETAAAVMVFGLSFTSAVLMNATFDVYLEGPQGAIPFWCAFGVILLLAEPVLRRSNRASR